MDIFAGITIDPPGSLDLDDAIHVERSEDRWVVRVAIPRVGAAVPQGGKADSKARARGATVYAGQSAREAMLPQEITAALSLTPGGERDALLVTIALEPNLAPSPPIVEPVRFRSAGRLSYDEANAILRTGSGEHHAVLSLADMLTRSLLRKRTLSGALGMRVLDNGLATDEEGRIVQGGGHAAQRIVQELMLLTNTALARSCAEQGMPILFRNHRPLPTASRTALLDDVALAEEGHGQLDTIAERIGLVAGRARLGAAAEGHWGLNLPVYAWFTSPLRRYADLVNQRILEAMADGRAHPEPNLDGLARHLNALQDTQVEAKAAFFKADAARLAERRLWRGDIGRLDANDFTGVVKASCEAGAVQPEILDEALARLATGRLTSKDIGRLLLAGPGPASRVIAGLAEQPPQAVMALNYLAQDAGWGQPAYEESSGGASHAMTHTVTARLSDGTRTYASPAVSSPSLKTSRQRAVVSALAVALGTEPPTWPTAPAPVASPSSPKPSASNGGDSPKTRLFALCQTRRWPLPTLDVTQSGPPHAPEFVAVATLNRPEGDVTSEPAKGRTRKDAEAASCAQILTALKA